MVIGPDLFLPAGVFLVLFLLGDLVEHLREEEVQSGVGFDGFLKGLQDGGEFGLVLVGIFDEVAEAFLVGSVILRQPAAGAGDVMFVWDAGVFHGGGSRWTMG